MSVQFFEDFFWGGLPLARTMLLATPSPRGSTPKTPNSGAILSHALWTRIPSFFTIILFDIAPYRLMRSARFIEYLL
ncbi:hypothetical protein SAMN02745108_02342 [Fibrobacter intestinalis]|uniref:Uncharacterized protein n=1 Tax=Fibrobacter intestinalis TaxID=28122 RepID=A0A1T4QNH8_9BACT|nr:hypothetical protein SAMN02745108_02342 [Fibrobacter intestinalis]